MAALVFYAGLLVYVNESEFSMCVRAVSAMFLWVYVLLPWLTGSLCCCKVHYLLWVCVCVYRRAVYLYKQYFINLCPSIENPRVWNVARGIPIIVLQSVVPHRHHCPAWVGASPTCVGVGVCVCVCICVTFHSLGAIALSSSRQSFVLSVCGLPTKRNPVHLPYPICWICILCLPSFKTDYYSRC